MRGWRLCRWGRKRGFGRAQGGFLLGDSFDLSRRGRPRFGGANLRTAKLDDCSPLDTGNDFLRDRRESRRWLPASHRALGFQPRLAGVAANLSPVGLSGPISRTFAVVQLTSPGRGISPEHRCTSVRVVRFPPTPPSREGAQSVPLRFVLIALRRRWKAQKAQKAQKSQRMRSHLM